MSESRRAGAMLNLAYEDKNELYQAFMPFVKNGGLFIQTSKPFDMGDEVFLLVTMPGESERIPIPAHVIWITPAGAQGNRLQGVGVQFKDNGQARTKIETTLAATLNSERPTHTM